MQIAIPPSLWIGLGMLLGMGLILGTERYYHWRLKKNLEALQGPRVTQRQLDQAHGINRAMNGRPDTLPCEVEPR